MDKVKVFLDGLGVSTNLELQDLKEMTDFFQRVAGEDGEELVLSFIEEYDGLYLSNYSKFIKDYKKQVLEIEEAIKELMFSVILNMDKGNDEFQFIVDRQFLGFSLSKREDVFEIIVPEWGIKKFFVEENVKEEEMEKCFFYTIEKAVRDCGIFEKIKEELPKILKEEIQEFLVDNNFKTKTINCSWRGKNGIRNKTIK